MKTQRLIGFVVLGVAATAITGVICEVRRRKTLRRLLDAANEGYETAHDIIYPENSSSLHNKKLRYGPVF
ncbi:MAG: hypothetical protein QM640_13820 [Niabella sp.]